jgi:hypothetical protein
MGCKLAPVYGGLLLPWARLPSLLTMTTVMGGLEIISYMCPRTVMIILIDWGPAFGGYGISSGAAKFLMSNHMSLNHESLPESVLVIINSVYFRDEIESIRLL